VEVICLNLVLVRMYKKNKKGCNKGGGSREGSDTFMSNTNYQGIEN
jgi:hypothetical protein